MTDQEFEKIIDNYKSGYITVDEAINLIHEDSIKRISMNEQIEKLIYETLVSDIVEENGTEEDFSMDLTKLADLYKYMDWKWAINCKDGSWTCKVPSERQIYEHLASEIRRCAEKTYEKYFNHEDDYYCTETSGLRVATWMEGGNLAVKVEFIAMDHTHVHMSEKNEE